MSKKPNVENFQRLADIILEAATTNEPQYQAEFALLHNQCLELVNHSKYKQLPIYIQNYAKEIQKSVSDLEKHKIFFDEKSKLNSLVATNFLLQQRDEGLKEICKPIFSIFYIDWMYKFKKKFLKNK